MRVDRLYVLTGFVWLVVGMVFGIYLGITEQFNLANSHAHANLLGFVVSVLFGLLYRGWPRMMDHSLAKLQFGIYQLGVLILVIGKYSIDSGGTAALAAPGSIVVVLGTLLMFWIFLKNTD